VTEGLVDRGKRKVTKSTEEDRQPFEIDDNSGRHQVSSDAYGESPRGSSKIKEDKKTRCMFMGVVSRGEVVKSVRLGTH
jgi:hypothetical protein